MANYEVMGGTANQSRKLRRVVIVGAGFGGLYAARVLRRAAVEVTIVDRRNHHLFQPLLYQVATAALSPGDIAYPIRAVLHFLSHRIPKSLCCHVRVGVGLLYVPTFRETHHRRY